MKHSSANNAVAEVDQRFDELVCQVTASFEAGESPDLATYEEDHPEFAERLRQLWPTLQAVADLGHLEESLPTLDNPAPRRGILGDFEIIREVGRGGMGIVFEAEQISLARRVALKVLPLAAVMDSKQLQRFKKEAQVAACLTHQNIVPVYSVGCERSVHFYAMQFVEGRTLADVVGELSKGRSGQKDGGKNLHVRDDHGASSSGRLLPGAPDSAKVNGGPTADHPTTGAVRPSANIAAQLDTDPKANLSTLASAPSNEYFRSIARLAIQAADALHYAHGEGVIHRDIKPSNLILDNSARLWVTDFGLAHLEMGQSLTITGDLIGTLRYMSPEQALAKRVIIDQRTDIYSLGITLYELVTLQPAFQGRDRQELLRQIAFDEPRRPRRLNHEIPVDLETIIVKAIEKHPGERYGSAEEMADDLRRYLERQPLKARRPTVIDVASKWSRRHKSLVASLGAAAAIVLVASAVIAGVVARREVQARNEIQDQKDRVSHLLAGSYVDKGQTLAEQGDVGAGMLWMAHALEFLPPQARDHRAAVHASLAAWHRQLHVQEMAFEHGAYVTSLDISADGLRVVSGGKDGLARLWSAITGEAMSKPLVHPDEVTAVAVSVDGKLALTGCADGKARIWHLGTANMLGTSLEHGEEIYDVAFSPDGKQCITSSKHKFCMWDLGHRQRVFVHNVEEPTWIMAAAYTTGGVRLAEATSDESRLYKIDGDKAVLIGPPIKQGRSNDHRPWSGSIGPRGEHFFVHHVLHAISGDDAGTPFRPGASVYETAISMDASRVVTAGADWTARVWDVATGTQIGEPLQHHGQVTTLALSEDETRLVTGSEDGAVRLWRLAANNLARISLLSAITDVAFSPTGSQLAVSDGKWGRQSLIIDLRSHETSRLEWGTGWGGFDFTQDGQLLLTGGARVWNTSTGKQVAGPLGLRVRSARISPDGSLVLTGSQDHTAQLWDTATGKPVGPPLVHDHVVTAVDFTPDGSRFITGGFDAQARIWRVATRELVGGPVQQHGEVKGLVCSPDGSRFLVGLANGTARIWDTEKLQPVGEPLVHRMRVDAVAFSPDGTLVATGSVDRTARVWDANTGKPIGPALLCDDWVNCIAFSPDGRYVAYGSWLGGDLYLWRLPTDRLEGGTEQIKLWTEIVTGLTINMDAQPVTRVLSVPQWKEKLARLQELGGPPVAPVAAEDRGDDLIDAWIRRAQTD